MAIFFFATAVRAQTDPPPDSVAEVSVEAEDNHDSSPDDETVRSYSDTLRQNFRSVVYDSIDAVNTDKGFYYKKYLDSLLRASKVREQRPQRSVNSGSLQGPNIFSSFFGIIFWILAIGLFGYLVYRLFLSNSSLFLRNKKNISSDVEVTLQENTNDPDALLRNAIRNGNYRLAVRYLYLQVLNRLAERKIIELNSNKTNYEYLNEVRKHKFVNEFASLTLQYEYVWYGEYPVDQKLFEQIQNSFNQFNKNLPR